MCRSWVARLAAHHWNARRTRDLWHPSFAPLCSGMNRHNNRLRAAAGKLLRRRAIRKLRRDMTQALTIERLAAALFDSTIAGAGLGDAKRAIPVSDVLTFAERRAFDVWVAPAACVAPVPLLVFHFLNFSMCAFAALRPPSSL